MPAVRSRDRTSGRDNQPKPRSDAYTGLLLLALLAQVAGAVFLYIDWSRYPATAPAKPPALAAAPSVGGPAAPGGNPAAPANPAPPAPPMGGGAAPPGAPGAPPPMGGGAAPPGAK